MINSTFNMMKAILMVLPLLFQSCKVDLPKDSKTIIKIEKSKCYGDCPTYSAVLKEKKWIEFYPKANTSLQKASYTKIKTTEYNDLLRIIESIPVKKLKNVYDNKLLMDAPTTYITFYKGGKKKKIKIRSNPPEKLKQLITVFEKIIGTSKWKPIPE